MRSRFRIPPWIVIGLILAGFGTMGVFVHEHIQTVVKPRQEAAHREKIEREIDAAHQLFQRKRWIRAVEQYEFVLRAYDEDLAPDTKAALRLRVGSALRREGLRLRDKAFLERARQPLHAVLETRSPDDPSKYREIQVELGLLHSAYHELTGDAAELEAAIGAWREALRVTDPQSDPSANAELWLRVGNAYRDLYAETPETRKIDPALTAYDEALKVNTLGAYPVQHARTQIERAAAYLAVAPHEAANRNSTRAVDALKQALHVLDKDTDRRYYGEAQKLLGDAYMLVAANPPSNLPSQWRYQHKYRHESLARRSYEQAEQAGVSRGTDVKTTD